MTWTRWRYINVPFVLTIAGILLGTLGSPALSQLSSEIEVADFEPPPVGAPGNRQDAGSRGASCGFSTLRFLALVPETNVGLTLAERPTFWLYVPCTGGEIEFELLDEETGETVYLTTFDVTDGPGIISMPVPEAAPSLETDKMYRWLFHFWSDNPENLAFVSGVVIREPLTTELKAELEDATPLERMAIYGKNGLWYDMLAEIGQGYRDNPQDEAFTVNWEALLQNPVVGLEDLLSEPLVSCCNAKSIGPTVQSE
ncbi:MAG: DUF928 domain-containing protein [Cyanobacteriota bacterium]|nr:DUF928 domain-containing protein [Cyanobacteriota bacterium]